VLCALLGATTLGMAAAPPADAAVGCIVSTFTPRLSVAKNFQRYSVDVFGVVPMTQEQAQGLINQGFKVQWRLWGDDPVFDDFLFGPDPASIASSPGALGLSITTQGLAFKGSRVTTGGTLDEDDSFFDDHDELYGAVRLLNASGGVVRCGKSNVVGGNF
jgi:hypothetical protein